MYDIDMIVGVGLDLDSDLDLDIDLKRSGLSIIYRVQEAFTERK